MVWWFEAVIFLFIYFYNIVLAFDEMTHDIIEKQFYLSCLIFTLQAIISGLQMGWYMAQSLSHSAAEKMLSQLETKRKAWNDVAK